MSRLRQERGTATLVVVTVIAALAILAVVNGRTLAQLSAELRRVEQRQTDRLANDR